MQNAETGEKCVPPRLAFGILLFICLPAVSLAGPIVTIELKNGKKIEAEIQSFYDGRFSVTDRQTKDVLELADSSIAVIDFGEIAREVPPPGFARTLSLAGVRTLAEEGRFILLLGALRNMALPRLKDLDGQIARQLEGTGLTSAARRDLGLARVLSLQVIGQAENSKSLYAKLRADYPGDAALQRFDREMQRVRESAAGRAAPQKKPGP